MQLSEKKGDKTKCLLCPHSCLLSEGSTGICGARINRGGNVELLTYGVVSGYSSDPVEKKPLYHYYPGMNILSLGSFGCNLKCDYCQNHTISQSGKGSMAPNLRREKLFSDIKRIKNNIGVAFTYNEPVIWYEYITDIATDVKKMGYHTVLVSNGFVNPVPLSHLIELTDAFNIDLKAFNNDFYRKLTGADIGPVKSGLKQIAKSGRHLEITTLIIPGQNDDLKEMSQQAEWIAGELGAEIPLHLSRYFPNYRRADPATGETILEKLKDKASEYLKYVYTGNVSPETEQNTKCPQCGTIVTIRSGYNTRIVNLDSEGRCTACRVQVYRNFTFSLSTEH